MISRSDNLGFKRSGGWYVPDYLNHCYMTIIVWPLLNVPFDIIADMKYHIWTSGCQMNVADSLRVASALEDWATSQYGWQKMPT